MQTVILDISNKIYEIADLFGQKAKETVLFENFGKHLLEIGFILKNIGAEGQVLDVGGGMGINLMCLRRLLGQGVELCLIDRFEEFTDDNRMGSSDLGLKLMNESRIFIVNQNFWENQNLPYMSEYFDLITCFDVIEHLPGHPLNLFREIKRVLKVNGLFILGAPNAISLHRRLKLLIGKHPYIPFDDWCRNEYFQHYREYSPGEMKALLKMAGFRVVKTILSEEPLATMAKNRYHNGYQGKFSGITLALYTLYLLERLLPGMRQSIYCKAKKNS